MVACIHAASVAHVLAQGVPPPDGFFAAVRTAPILLLHTRHAAFAATSAAWMLGGWLQLRLEAAVAASEECRNYTSEGRGAERRGGRNATRVRPSAGRALADGDGVERRWQTGVLAEPQTPRLTLTARLQPGRRAWGRVWAEARWRAAEAG